MMDGFNFKFTWSVEKTEELEKMCDEIIQATTDMKAIDDDPNGNYTQICQKVSCTTVLYI